MTKSSNGILLYRATRDGFEGTAFHNKCDGKANTLTIIKTNGNYVFGGYTAGKWNSDGIYASDTSAFIFSLRRNSVSNSYNLKVALSQYAIYGGERYGPTFGGGHDIKIIDKSNINTGSYTYFCSSYQCPAGYSFGDTSKSFLAGIHSGVLNSGWLTTEIEVFQI